MAMYWKYHIESDDLVQFMTAVHVENEKRIISAEGTVLGWVPNDTFEAVEAGDMDMSDVDTDDLALEVQSGRYVIRVPLDDVTERTKADDREGDLPKVGEELLRWGNGIVHSFMDDDDPEPEAADEIRTRS